MDIVKQGRPVRRAAGLLVLAAGLSPVALAQATSTPAPPPVEAKSASAKSADGLQVFEAAYFQQHHRVPPPGHGRHRQPRAGVRH